MSRKCTVYVVGDDDAPIVEAVRSWLREDAVVKDDGDVWGLLGAGVQVDVWKGNDPDAPVTVGGEVRLVDVLAVPDSFGATLDLVKHLRAQGVTVILDPDDARLAGAADDRQRRSRD